MEINIKANDRMVLDKVKELFIMKMGLTTTENGLMTDLMDLEFLNIKMEIFMKASDQKIKDMERENYITTREFYMKENEQMITLSKDKELQIMGKKNSLKDNEMKGKNKDLEFYVRKMARLTKVNDKKIKSMDMVYQSMKMVINMKDNGNKINNKEKVYFIERKMNNIYYFLFQILLQIQFSSAEINMKVYDIKDKNKVKEFTIIQVEKNQNVIEIPINYGKEMESQSIKMETYEKVNGHISKQK